MDKTYLELLKEFRTMPGVGEVEELEFEGIKVYTNKKLKENVRNTTKKYLSPLSSGIVSRLIDSGHIIPVFISKNIIDYIKRRYKKTKFSNIYGRTTSDGTIYLFLDQFYSLPKILSINEKKLNITILHELIHLSSDKKPTQFYKINNNYIVLFFKYFFSSYFKISKNKIPDILINNIIKTSLKYLKKNYIDFGKIYNELLIYMEKNTTLNEIEFNKLNNIFEEFLINAINKHNKPIDVNIWKAGNYAYKKLVGEYSESLGQEFWDLSEIISIMGGLNFKHPVVNNSLKLLI